MRRALRPHRGFTLIEVLIVLVVLALLAGFLVPAIASHVRKSDVSRLGGDLENIRAGIEAFTIDVRRYPGDIEDMVSQPGAADSTVHAEAYPSGLASRWTGPYLDIVIAEGGTFKSGFNAEIQDDFLLGTVGGARYLAIIISPISQADFLRVDASIDTDTSSTLGRFLLFGDTAVFLALPVDQGPPGPPPEFTFNLFGNVDVS